MINFIVVDDQKEFLKETEKRITKIMFENNIKYNIFQFNSFDKDFNRIMKKPLENKIYILDIIIGKTKEGILNAHKIRSRDTHSIIIFISSYQKENQNEILKATLQYFAIINKLVSKEFEHYLHLAIKQLSREKTISYELNGEYYFIKERDILYIYYNRNFNKSIIKSGIEEYVCPYSLKELEEKTNLIRTSNSFLVNKNKIKKISFKNKSILFSNGNEMKCISQKFTKKEFEELIGIK